MVRGHWRKIKKARQRLLLCRLMIDMIRTVHGAYAPASERLGTRPETFFIALCVALGDIDGKPFSVAKIASYVRVPRTTVELSRNLGDDERLKAAYRGGCRACQNLPKGAIRHVERYHCHPVASA